MKCATTQQGKSNEKGWYKTMKKLSFTTKCASGEYYMAKKWLAIFIAVLTFFLLLGVYNWRDLLFGGLPQLTSVDDASGFVSSWHRYGELDYMARVDSGGVLTSTTYSDTVLVMGGMGGAVGRPAKSEKSYQIYFAWPDINGEAVVLALPKGDRALAEQGRVKVEKPNKEIREAIAKEVGAEVPVLVVRDFDRYAFLPLLLFTLLPLAVCAVLLGLLRSQRWLCRHSQFAKSAARYGDPRMLFEKVDSAAEHPVYRNDVVLVGDFGLVLHEQYALKNSCAQYLPMSAVTGADCELVENYGDGEEQMRVLVYTAERTYRFLLLGEQQAGLLVSYFRAAAR